MKTKSPKSKVQSLKSLKKEILDVLLYFFFFNYPPTFEEIYSFLKIKASKRRITSILEKMEKQRIITSHKIVNSQLLIAAKTKKITINNQQSTIDQLISPTRYTLPEYKNSPTTLFELRGVNNQQLTISNFLKRQQISIIKLRWWKFKLFLQLLSLVPSIKLVGLSGSVSMLNADDSHDVDLFIIAAKNRLFTGRFTALALAQLLSIRRKYQKSQRLRRPEYRITQKKSEVSDIPDSPSLRYSDKVCLNLFFDQTDLAVPKFKRNIYVAHEVLQMKPLVDKDGTYLSFIDANKWVFGIFPNSKFKFQSSNVKANPNFKAQEFRFWILKLICNLNFVIWISNNIESFLKNLQLKLIGRHQTTEIITDSQLWFHPDDFEKKIKIK